MAKAPALTIVILDDEESVEKEIRSRLPKLLQKSVTVVKPSEIAKLAKQLGQRIVSVRSSGEGRARASETVIDKADLFIVDYDLIAAAEEDYLTGEHIAYLARCYSRCGVIVALNQFHRQPTFDLTLKAQLESFADLNISAEDLANSGLWKSSSWTGYRPWAWPVLPNLIALMQKRIEDLVKTDLKTPVLEYLSFPRSATERLPTASLELLGCDGDPTKAALKDILTSPILGLRGKEASRRQPNQDEDAHIIAARLSLWLNMVLASQDVLIDAPHLVERCPSTLGLKPSAKDFTKVVSHGSDFSGLKPATLTTVKFQKTFWFDRPVWFWTEIEKERLVPEIQDPWKYTRSDFAFCEDTSSFKKRSSARSFQSDFVSPYRTRYVSNVQHVEYQPAHRLALS